ncbi:hypothetical protein [Streptomyces virginiae]|uniref:hypothetical protein n=1 Tax=Streptomyces virginiae TaxID=1961 RepID=UPI0005269C88|nr:hypothetical protein [Streptomyces virginiae]
MPGQRHQAERPQPGATKLGLSNTTFRRHFPDLAKEISTIRSNPEPTATEERHPSPYEILAARNAKLRRTNRSLTENLRFAAAQIQHLAVDNARLREGLEASSNGRGRPAGWVWGYRGRFATAVSW